MQLSVAHPRTGGDSVSVTQEKFDPKHNPAVDLQYAIVDAKKSGRRILLDVGGEWCKWCHRLDSVFAMNPDIADFMHKYYVVLKVNFSPENENDVFLSKYPEVAGYPHLFVLDADGTLLHSQDTGALEAGRKHDPDKVRQFLKDWAPTTKR